MENRSRCMSLLVAVALAGCVTIPISATAAPCESLRNLSLPNTTITTAVLIPAGPFQTPGNPAPPPIMLPAHCRVAAVLTPSSDSHIEIEVWLPMENWNGKFQAVGNGGWAGVITYGSAICSRYRATWLSL
jgi:hypothetical protein